MIWAGTDDGLIQLTRNGGKTWQDVTPPGLTPWSKVSQIDAGRFEADTAYAAINRLRLDDLRPHIYRTHDGGKTWKETVQGLPETDVVNAVREDPVRRAFFSPARNARSMCRSTMATTGIRCGLTCRRLPFAIS